MLLLNEQKRLQAPSLNEAVEVEPLRTCALRFVVALKTYWLDGIVFNRNTCLIVMVFSLL